jgi:hypothetical protein
MMNLEKVIFGFFILLALTLNLAFVVGDIDNQHHHNVWLLFVAVIINFIATGLKLGDRSQVGALLLSASLVADLQLIVAASVWTLAVYSTQAGLSPGVMATVVSLAAGALFANTVSVVMLVSDTLMSRR